MLIFSEGEFSCFAQDIVQAGQSVTVECRDHDDDGVELSLDVECDDHMGSTRQQTFRLMKTHTGKDSTLLFVNIWCE